jgi:hypothetical protein
MSSYHYSPSGDRIEDESSTDSTVDAPAGKWLPEPGCVDAWGDQNSGEDCPHGVPGGLDLSWLGHTRCRDCGGRRYRFKRRLTGRHPINHDRIKSAWKRDAA